MLEKNVYVYDNEGQELFSCTIDEEEKAFEFAKQMEKLNIEVSIESPSLVETLGIGLGITEKERSQLKDALFYEIKNH